MTFCPECGKPSLTSSPQSCVCRACGFTLFFNAAAAVGAIIECDSMVLASVRANPPAAGQLDLPGGFVDHGETAEQAIKRELEEELNLKNVVPVYFGTYPNVYPYKSITYHTLDLIFTISLPAMERLTPKDDVAAIRWIKKSELVIDQFAFASMRVALSVYLR